MEAVPDYWGPCGYISAIRLTGIHIPVDRQPLTFHGRRFSRSDICL